ISFSMTFAPAAARRFAIARPIPRPEPVTSAVLPCRVNGDCAVSAATAVLPLPRVLWSSNVKDIFRTLRCVRRHKQRLATPLLYMQCSILGCSAAKICCNATSRDSRHMPELRESYCCPQKGNRTEESKWHEWHWLRAEHEE